MYREGYKIFGCCGILFNHESERRGENFVTRKIVREAARIKKGLSGRLSLGNLDARRDWGHAKDYVRAMYLMLQQPKADDYVIATGVMHSVRDFLDEAFSYLQLDWHDFVVTDPRYMRPTEVDALRGDASKAEKILGWKPEINFASLVREMVDAEMTRLN